MNNEISHLPARVARGAGAIRRRRAELCALAVSALAAACGSSTTQGPPAVSPPAPPGAPATMVATAEITQVGFAGHPVSTLPAVRVLDGSGAGMAGVEVTFLADAGSGTTAGREVTTGADGVAAVGSWTLGPDPGTHRLHATAAGLPRVTFLAIATVPPAVFDIVIRFNRPGGTPAQRTAFRVAEARWQAVLQAEQPDVAIQRSAGFCGSTEPISETVDDLLILADLVAIDGPGGTLGSAGPCLLRSNGIPVIGRMRFDVADLDAVEADGTLDDLIVHEMGHVLGIGSLWGVFDLARIPESGPSETSDAYFVGPSARAAFDAAGGADYVGNRVPIENSGGAGTRFVHWRESVFGNELMTGYLDSGSNPLSLVTIASLEDMGYTVDRAISEAFSLSVAAAGAGSGGAARSLGDDVLRGPIYQIDATGAIRPLRIR